MKIALAVVLGLTLLVGPAAATGLKQRVKFAAGASGSVVKGTVDPSKAERFTSGADTYVLGASKGQKVTVNVDFSSQQGVLYVYHMNGGKDYNTGCMGRGTGQNLEQEMVLPANGDFFIEVGSQGGKVTYTLSVTIE